MFHRNWAGEREDGIGWHEEGTGESVMARVLGYAPDIYQLIQSCHASGSKMDMARCHGLPKATYKVVGEARCDSKAYALNPRLSVSSPPSPRGFTECRTS